MKKFNFRLFALVLASLVDEAILFIIVLWLLPLVGIELPVWVIILLAAVFLGIGIAIYFLLSGKPTLGFESQIGMRGITETRIARQGTVRIGNELWSAATTGEAIEKDTPVVVINQKALILIVSRELPS
ncbi:MAG: NfeD family protein [Dehalogenimonas sp.]|uniref:NfeD family protein n=1 Tax=Candidatus Dehalogenimonas loeffleri TaxID=3127115 RepID=A0ABZ2J5F8_9CHLR|nr:NfeD family protein [Dehalogenimonas sp.]